MRALPPSFVLIVLLAASGNPARSSPPARLTPEEASARALNTLSPVEGGWLLHHPRHRAHFDDAGIRFEPRRGPTWSWSLAGVEVGGRLLEGFPERALAPVPGPDRPSREYGLIAEQVAEVFPELVVTDETGRPYTVRYDQLAPLLLNELQRLARRVEELEGAVRSPTSRRR